MPRRIVHRRGAGPARRARRGRRARSATSGCRGRTGVALLEEVRRRYPDTAVIMLSAVADVQIAVECLKQGALDYIAKPMILEEVQAPGGRARSRSASSRCRTASTSSTWRTRSAASGRRIQEFFLEGAQTLAHALEAKDAYTRGHSQRVRDYAVRTAVLLGFTGDFLDNLRLGAELHDIGKIGTREAVLNKPGRLTARRVPAHHRAHRPRREDPGAAGARPSRGAAHRALAPRAARRRRLPRRARPATTSRSRRASWRWWTPSTR